jgi:hypothetical protein
MAKLSSQGMSDEYINSMMRFVGAPVIVSLFIVTAAAVFGGGILGNRIFLKHFKEEEE